MKTRLHEYSSNDLSMVIDHKKSINKKVDKVIDFLRAVDSSTARLYMLKFSRVKKTYKDVKNSGFNNTMYEVDVEELIKEMAKDGIGGEF